MMSRKTSPIKLVDEDEDVFFNQEQHTSNTYRRIINHLGSKDVDIREDCLYCAERNFDRERTSVRAYFVDTSKEFKPIELSETTLFFWFAHLNLLKTHFPHN